MAPSAPPLFVRETNPCLAPWEERLRESNRRHADAIGRKLAAVGCLLAPLISWTAERWAFTPAAVERLAEMEHDRWVKELRGQG